MIIIITIIIIIIMIKVYKPANEEHGCLFSSNLESVVQAMFYFMNA